MQDFEKLGAFYLGKTYDVENGQIQDELLLYDSKDLLTHAVCVGMTGSGKTGLCLSLLEEAAIDGIPAIAIDPKGDIGNLFLTFPKLQPADFRPWIDEGAATRAGLTADQFAKQTADRWREGLKDWGQTPERIKRLRQSIDLALYTPGSNAGLPLTILRSFDAPPPELVEDADGFRERIASAASGLLALLGIDADPVKSREHILISNLLDRAWREGRSLDIATLIREIQNPPFDKVGIFDMESFFPSGARMELAMSLNGLLASPSFAGWMKGEPLDIKRLLYTPEGRPRLSVISIAHLSDAERMFFLTILLNEVLAWVRGQPGTTSLRALLYMDEVFGYFPPTANPPTKTPMLTLLKQARAYGLGVVLATQNPVDLDYKGLSNTGTWFLGRLQTERDKRRVLEGLEGASSQAGADFDRARMEATLAGLDSRVFLMNNVHDDAPVVFHTRWALSYLRGPLTRKQIETITAERKRKKPKPAASAVAAQKIAVPAETETKRVSLPRGVKQYFLTSNRDVSDSSRLVYRPALLGRARLHFVRATYKADVWREHARLTMLRDEVPSAVWDESASVDADALKFGQRDSTATLAELPSALSQSKSYTSWKSKLKDCLYRDEKLSVWKCAALKTYSHPGESEGDFRIRLTQQAKEARDLQVEKLRSRYASKLATLESRMKTAKERVSREKAQAQKATLDSAISIGSSILGALFGRKLASRTNVSKASTSMRSVGRAAQQRSDIGRAEDRVEDLQEQLSELDKKFHQDVKELEAKYAVQELELEELPIRPRKSDIQIREVAVFWTPWTVDSAGIAEPAFDLDGN